jgi:translocation and assembly module TamB
MALGFSLMGSPRFRFVRWIGYLLLTALVVAFFAPIIVAKTPISTWLIAQATKDLPINVTVGSLSLNWLSPIVAENVVIQDTKGGALAEIPRLATQNKLWSLALWRQEIGKVRIERANVDLVFANNTSNLETVLAQWPKAETKPATLPRRGPPAASYAIECVESTVRVVDSAMDKSWQLAKLEFRLAHDAVNSPPLSGSLTASVTGEGDPGSIDLRMDGDMIAAIKGKLAGKFQSIPAGLVGPILRRSHPGLLSSGRLHLEGVSNWYLAQDGTPVFRLGAKLDGQNLEFTGGPVGEDRVAIKSLELPVHIEYTGTYLTVEQGELVCDLGRASAKGKLTFSRPLLASLGDATTAVTADLDLAQLARVMPKTLSVHNDVRVGSGRLKVETKNLPSPAGALLEVKVTTTDLRGTRGNAAISWLEPLTATFKMRTAGKAFPEIEELVCKSGFMTLDGRATANGILLRGNADLGQLTPTLGQFLDVAAWGLGGQADMKVGMAFPDKNTLDIDAEIKLDQFQWGKWREESRQLTINAVVQLIAEGSQYRVDKTSTLKVFSGADLLDVKFRDHFVVSKEGQAGSIYAELNGDLARWNQRLRPFAGPLADAALQGQATGKLWLTLAPRKIDVQAFELSAKEFRAKSASFDIRDPALELKTSLAYDGEQEAIEVRDTLLQCQAMWLHTKKLSIDGKRKSMLGSVRYAGDLGRLHEWFGSPTPGGDVWAGTFDGQADLLSSTESFDIDMKSSIKGVAFGPAKAPRFSDPHVEMRAKGNFAGRKDTLRLERVLFTGQLGSIDAEAKITKFDSTMDLDVNGTFTYDLAMIEPLLKSYLGAGARIEGKDRREFRFVGPLRPKGAAPGAAVEFTSLKGNGGASWKHVVAFGADVGPADIKANLDGGWLRIDPIAASLNQGNLKLAPAIRMAPVYELHMPAGPVIEHAKISPAMFAGALGYTLPLLANVASADGELSLQLAGARVPLGAPEKSSLEGTLMLHRARVGPSPLITEILGILKTASPHSIIRESQIKVKLDKGRVHHEGLELLLTDNYTVRTYGSVGLDSSLDMIVEMPLPTKLLGNLKLPASVGRTIVRLPITGTITRPTIDRRALEDALAQAAREAAGGAVGDILRKGLDSQLNKLLKQKN